ncbi:MAG: 4Fe-4S dicluster domain-containing protein [Bacteroidales bacterium]|nr:4Fe-4S dicluster domain-containing protein [Bacteroidales bacterium]
MQHYFKKIRVFVALFFMLAFIIAFSDIKGTLPSWYYNSFLYLQFVPSVLKFITPGHILAVGFIIVLLFTLAGGRVYCSTICPLGTLQDMVIFLRRRFSPKSRLRFKKALTVMRYSVLSITIVSLLFSGMFALVLLDPYANFSRIGTHILQPAILWVNNLLARTVPETGLHVFEYRPFHVASFTISAGMLMLVFIMSVFRGRLYCNSICPVGTLLGLVSKLSFYKIQIEPASCTKCGKCQAVCKANCINIKTLEVDSSRCVACYNCIPACNDSSIGYIFSGKKILKLNEPASDKRRRLFIATIAGYLASKTLPLKASGKPGGNRVDKGFYERGTVSPPGSQSIEHLHERCISCHMCISACPTKVLQPTFLEYGFTGMMMPKMDYSVHFCNFDCTVCGEVCPTGAITRLTKDEKTVTQIGKVVFQKEICIVETDGTACGSCSEHCPTQAVKMVPYKNGLTIPHTDVSICIGCGACEYACPVTHPHKAIFVVANARHEKAQKPQAEKIEHVETDEFPF